MNEAICQDRPVSPPVDQVPLADGRERLRKWGLFGDLQARFASEVERLAALTTATLTGSPGDGLATVELAIRTAMTNLGASLLEDLLAMGTGHRGPRIDCGSGHLAEFVSYRGKTIVTVLGPIELSQA